MLTRFFGKTGIKAGVLGYGAMALSLEERSEPESMEILGKALDSGVTFFDTADTYCRGPSSLHHNERLLARMLESLPKDGPYIFLATKGGTVRTERGWEVDGAPDFLYRGICESFEALGGKRPISLWQHHWPDPRHSITAMLEPVARAVNEKLVRFVGVANYSVEQLREARDVVDVVSVQNQYNFWNREPEHDGVLEYCEQEGLIFLPWRPMGGLGLAQRLGEIGPLAGLAHERGISPQRLVVAWHLAKSKCILPIPGSSRLEHILDCLAAEKIRLEPREIALLNAISEKDLPERIRPAAWKWMPPLTRKDAS